MTMCTTPVGGTPRADTCHRSDKPGGRPRRRDWLATVTPTLLARKIPDRPGSFYALMPQCLRLDVVTEPVSDLAATPFRRRVVVLDRDGLDRGIPAPQAGEGPDLDRMSFLVEEFYRMFASFPPAVLARKDWLLGVVGVQANRQMLYGLSSRRTNHCRRPV